MLNKAATTRKIIEQTRAHCVTATKLQLDNILFPKWSDMGPMGLILAQAVKTKEQPTGCFYDEAAFRIVLRVLGGKVFMSGRPDCYSWNQNKVAKLNLDPQKLPFIGVHSADGLIRLGKLLETVQGEADRKWLAELFVQCNQDYLLVTTPAEQRTVVEVTQELYNKGLTACVDEWMQTDADGNAEETKLYPGDFLVISGNGVYRIGREEFNETHRID